MPKVNKTLENPNGLTGKQRLTAEVIAGDIASGKGLNGAEAHGKVYRVKDKHVASVVSNKNMHIAGFRNEIVQGLEKRKVLGVNGILQRRLAEGLSGKPKTKVEKWALEVRLKYAQEVSKILGTHAPVKVDQRTLNVKATVKPKELHQNIEGLEGELSE